MEKTKKLLKILGIISLIKTILTIARYPDFISNLIKFRKLYNKESNKRFLFSFIDLFPCVNDKTANTGFDKHYVFHTAWAARKVQKINPPVHYDISSSLYFNTLVSAFVPIRFFDYRPAIMNLSGITSEHADLY